MTTIRFSTEYLHSILTSFNVAMDEHFTLFRLHGSRIILGGGDGCGHSSIKLLPNWNLFFKEIAEGIEFIAIIGDAIARAPEETKIADALIARAAFKSFFENRLLPYLDSDDEMEEEELMHTTFNSRSGAVSSYIHESAQIMISAIKDVAAVVDILLWIEPNPSNSKCIEPKILAPHRFDTISAVLKKRDKRKKSKRKRKQNRKMKKLRICPICNISNKEYKFYKCSACRRATYCSRLCQKKHWKMFHSAKCAEC